MRCFAFFTLARCGYIALEVGWGEGQFPPAGGADPQRLPGFIICKIVEYNTIVFSAAREHVFM